MQLQLKAEAIWVANEPVDFRLGLNGLSTLIAGQTSQEEQDCLYVFYNRRKDKVKLIGRHQHGMVLVYKRLEKRRFTFRENQLGYYEVSESMLSWLLAGLDWVSLSELDDEVFPDLF